MASEKFMVTGLEVKPQVASPKRSIATFTVCQLLPLDADPDGLRINIPPIEVSLSQSEVFKARNMVYDLPGEGLMLTLKRDGRTRLESDDGEMVLLLKGGLRKLLLEADEAAVVNRPYQRFD